MEINKKLLNIFKKTKTTSDEDTYTCSYINDLVEKNCESVHVWASNDQIITGNSSEVINDMEITLTTTGKPLLISWSIPSISSGGSPQFQLFVDEVQKLQFLDSIDAKHINSYTYVLTGIPSGEHTFQLKGNKGNASSLTISAYTEKSFSVIEL